jgi:hypothetical protein
MMPYDSYKLYEVQRPKSATEIRCADEQLGRFAALVSGLFRSITRPRRISPPKRGTTLPSLRTCRIVVMAIGSLAVAAAGICLTSLADQAQAARLPAHIALAPTLTSGAHLKVPARDAFSGRITARTGSFRGEHGHATADLAVSASGAATRRLTLTVHARLCKMSKQCVRLTGHLKGTITALAGTTPDVGRSFTIRVAGVIKRLGHVRVHGRVRGTGFVRRGRESMHLTATGHAGRFALYAHSPRVRGFTSP